MNSRNFCFVRVFVSVSVFMLLTAFLSSSSVICASEEESKAEVYSIGKGDVLEISVWQSPDLTKSVTVESDGMMEYSFMGRIQAEGKTTYELQQTITSTLKGGYVKDPRVGVSVKEYNSKKILVFGEVIQPGLYKIKGNMPLLELLFMVGGVKTEAKRLTVIRTDDSSATPVPQALKLSSNKGNLKDVSESAIEVDLLALLSKGNLAQNITIRPGDTIYVSSGTGERFYVLGQVRNPGPYEWVPDLTVLDAIKLAEGPTELAALNRITVRRKRSGREEQIKVNVLDIMKGRSKDDVSIEPDSIIVVPKSWI